MARIPLPAGSDYRPEYKGLTGTFEIDDLTTLENTQGK